MYIFWLTWIIYKIKQKNVELNLRIYELNVRTENIWRTKKKYRLHSDIKLYAKALNFNVLIIPFKH